MTTHTEIALTCPACGTEFSSTSWMSTNIFGKKTDFQPITAGFSPLSLYIHTCTECGFTGNDGEFEEGHDVASDLAQKIRTELGPLVRDGRPDAATRYEFAARIAEWRGDDEETIANAYLFAAWCSVDEGETESESRYRLSAIEHFKKALDVEGLLAIDRVPEVVYLIGELYRRVGEVKLAREWFNRVIDQWGDSEDALAIVKLAQQQRDDPQDQLGEA